ncbi:6688_t:CDS:2, partial [Gigaspora margarita]
DVIQLSSNLKISPFTENGVMLIVARRFEIGEGCHISIDYKKFFRIVVYTMEMPHELKIITRDQTIPFIIDNSNIGKCLTLCDEEGQRDEDIDTFDSAILKKDSFFKIIQFSLQIATALFYEESKTEIVESILSWIIKLTKSQFKQYTELYYQALSIFTQLKISKKRRESKASFVLLLNKEIYKDRIKNFLRFAISYEDKYNNVLVENYTHEIKKKEFETLLKDCNDMTRMHKHLKGIEETRYNSSLKLRKNEENKLRNKIHDVKEKLETVGVGKIVVQPGGIVSFIETIEKISSSINDALNAAEAKIEDINNDLKSNFKKAESLNNEVEKGEESIQSLDIRTLETILETED